MAQVDLKLKPATPKRGAKDIPPRLSGIFAPVVTPLKKDLSVDLAMFARHCLWLLKTGCNGLAVFGTNSEGNSFSIEERIEMLDHIIGAGVPPEVLMPGTGCCAIPDTVKLSRAAVEMGASGVLMLPPFYFKGVSDDGVFAAYSEVIERVGDARLRIYVYHFPAMSAVPLGLPLIERLVKRYPESVVGMKDSTGDADAMIKVAQALPGFAVFSGADQAVLPALKGGAVGSITAGANIACDLAQEIFSTYKTAPDKAAAAQERLSKVRAVLGSYLPLPAVVKAVLARHTNNPAWLALRPPLDALTAAQADDVWTKLTATGFTPAPVG